ncbi:MAG: hypothetical protein HKN58_00405 [Xanthomonadales bacterium]|nr:hypothetical protein [Xanthomonadales bacterium]
MSSPLQRAYLDAMGIPVWLSREPAVQPAGTETETAPESQPAMALQLGPGSGPVLLLCQSVSEPASALATDIARSLDQSPVWGWPVAEAEATAVTEVISEGLFTHVIVFGHETIHALFGANAPETVGAACVLRAPSLAALADSPAERKSLWRTLRQNHLAGTHSNAGGGADAA